MVHDISRDVVSVLVVWLCVPWLTDPVSLHVSYESSYLRVSGSDVSESVSTSLVSGMSSLAIDDASSCGFCNSVCGWVMTNGCVNMWMCGEWCDVACDGCGCHSV